MFLQEHVIFNEYYGLKLHRLTKLKKNENKNESFKE